MRLKRTIILLILFFIVHPIFLFSGKSIILEEIFNPQGIMADGDNLYITDQHSLFVFSLKKGEIILQVGKKGSGPAEFLYTPDVQLLDNGFLLYSSNRFAVFNLKGELIKQKTLTFPVFKIHQTGENYVTHQWTFHGKERFSEMIIYDKNLKKITSIFEERKKIKSLEQTIKSTRFIATVMTFKCAGRKIVLADGKKGFYFKVFDSLGNHLKTIKKEYKPLPVRDKDKSRFIEIFKNKSYLRNRWHIFKRIAGDLDKLFPEYFPAYEDFLMDNQRLYVRTYERLNGKARYVILNLEGEELEQVWLPIVERKLCAIGKEKFFYLVENEDSQEWELFSEKISTVK